MRIIFRLRILCLVLLLAGTAYSQTTAFAYQGRLTDGGNPANGNYDMQFRLFDNANVGQGTQQGATITISTVAVASGSFKVELDFGASAFAAGADRFLEIGVRPAGSSAAYIGLTPRQKLTSSPYSVRSKSSESADALSTNCVGCVQNSQINSIDGNKVTGSVANSTTAANANNLGGLPTQRFVKFALDGTVSIGTTGTGSALTVGGVVESTAGGFKFPDGSQQTSAGLTTVVTNSTLTGDGTNAAPLGINSPILVRDIDNPARQPFQYSLDSSGPADSSIVIVPQGKTLVIEYINGFVQKSTSVNSASIGLTLFENGQPTGYRLYYFLTAQGFEGCCRLWDISQQIRLYVGPGQELRLSVDSNTLLKRVAFAGYYVDSIPALVKAGEKNNASKK